MVFASAVCWSFSGVLSKNLDWNGFSKAGVRAVVAVLIYAAARKTWKFRLNRTSMIGALGVSMTSILYMLALSFTTSANAIVLQYSMPVYVVLIDWVMFRIKPGIKQIIVIPLLLFGVVLCCFGKSAGSTSKAPVLGNVLAILSGVAFAVVFLTARMKEADPLEYTYLGNLITTLLCVSIFFDPGVGLATRTDLKEWFLILIMGITLGMGYLLLAKGLTSTGPVTSAILENLEPVLNPVWVFLFIGERPDTLGIIGCAAVMITVTVYACIPEKKV